MLNQNVKRKKSVIGSLINQYYFNENQPQYKRDRLSRISILSAAGFFALFPGFFLYHTLIGRGLMPAIIGGFFRPMVIVFIVLVVFSMLLGNDRLGHRKDPIGLIYVLILIWTTVIALWNYFLGKQVGNLEMLDWSISYVLIDAACYLIGKHLPLSSKVMSGLLVNSLTGMVLIVLFLSTDGMFDLRGEGLGDQEKTATYQGFARSLGLTGILSIALTQRESSRAAMAIATIIALYVNGARSEFVCTIAACLAFWSLITVKSQLRVWFSVGFFCLIIILMLRSIDNLQEILPQNRILELFDLSTANSAIQREELAQAGWEEIIKNPLFGNYGFYYQTDGVGGFSHDISGAWVNLGGIGFSGYVILLIALFLEQIHSVRSGYIVSALGSAALLTFVASFVAVLFAKEYTYELLACAVGLTGRLRYSLKLKQVFKQG